ncbi:MAG: alanine racemase [Mahellales bacterium]|jgi:alanine racemase
MYKEDASRPTWLEIDLENIKYNIKSIKEKVQSSRVIAVVKADAYGHGALEVSMALMDAGVDYLAVATVEEGEELRQGGITCPILILGAIEPAQAARVISNNLEATVFDQRVAKALNEAAGEGSRVDIHIKVDTGMGRLGVRPGWELDRLLTGLSGLKNLNIKGIYTHFATSDEADKSYTSMQISYLGRCLDSLRAFNIDRPLVHAANSGAILDMPDTYYDAVRPGIILYGYYPSQEVKRSIDLKPAMEWKTRIVHLKDVEIGCCLSYGRTYTTTKMSRIATLPVGYADGYKRVFGNRAQVLVRGKRAPVVGRVCMDQCMVDVTDIEGIKLGDEVVLMGSQGGEAIWADELAMWDDTISYEILTNITKRVPRLYKKGGKSV